MSSGVSLRDSADKKSPSPLAMTTFQPMLHADARSVLFQRPGSDSGSVSSGGSLRDSAERESPSPPAMTTFQSVASSVAASLAALTGKPVYPPGVLFPHFYLPQPLADTLRLEALPKPEPPPPSLEQPLDLSAKAPPHPAPPLTPPEVPSLQPLVSAPGHSSSLKVPALNRHIFKAKPRISAVAGRRTYTEEELQAALRDIQSGKLGTRRAAVIYGIPRSTLRNKVYKLAMERERDSHLVLAANPELATSPVSKRLIDVKDEDDLQDDDEERDLSGAEEEREVEKALMKPLISMEDLIRVSSEGQNIPGTDSLRTLLQHGSKFLVDQKKEESGSSPPLYPVFPHGAELWTGLEHSALGPYISQILAATGGNPAVLAHTSFVNLAGRGSPADRSVSPADFLPKFSPPLLPEMVRRMMVEDRLLVEEHHKKDPRQFQFNGRLDRPSSSTTNTTDRDDSGSTTPPNVILRIPSFKPGSKNGIGDPITAFPPGVKLGESSHHAVSPPLSGGRSESSSPPSMVGKGSGVNLRDVIAKSISQKFQQPPDMHHILHTPPGIDHYKRGDFHPHGYNHPAMRNHNNNHVEERKMPSKQHVSGIQSSGGKGTRPKRGKYRNYDRDSLVEAVRAVQRGEMSVHRAGSYYGVPHSTLEYKVKERHLMRPRKREPKPQQLEEAQRKDDAVALRAPPDKVKSLPPKPPKPPFTPVPSISTAPNGLKIPPIFDPSMTYAAAPPFPFWPPNPFHHLPMDYPRGPNFTPPEQFFASQMIQRLQEDSNRPSTHTPPPLGKTAREMAESLYDGTGANGSFLDGIIRSSLETGLSTSKAGGTSIPEHMSNKALLDQLCRSRLTPLSRTESGSGEEKKHKLDSVVTLTSSTKTSEAEDEPKRPSSSSSHAGLLDDLQPTPSSVTVKGFGDESACDNKHTSEEVCRSKETEMDS